MNQNNRRILLQIRLVLSLGCIFIAACVPTQATPPLTDAQPASVFTAIPTLTVPPPTATYAPSPLDDAANIIYYFSSELCTAKWTNNGQEIPCPSAELNPSGTVRLLNQTDLSLPYAANAILSMPAQDRVYLDIFGAFPARKIELGDFFRAQLHCLPNTQCDVTFSLGYYDANGKFFEPFPAWPYNYTEIPRLINFPLDILAGQTVQLVLIVRDNGDPSNDFAIWVEPRIFRHLESLTPIPQP